jgi:Xaa-Pro aminopeptidase
VTIYENRLQALRDVLSREQCELYLSLYPPDNQYLTGFTGSTSAVIVTASAALFLCDPRYTEQARSQVQAFEVEEVRGGFLLKVAERIQSLNVGSVATDPGTLTVAQAHQIRKFFDGEMRYIADAVADLRMVKDPA